MLFHEDGRAASASVSLAGDGFGAVDWDQLVIAARAHGLSPLLAKRLHELEIEDKVPSRVLQTARQERRANEVRNILVSQELLRVYSALEDASCCPVALKGVALLAAGYESMADRLLPDVDLLVRPDRTEVAVERMRDLGYEFPSRSCSPELYRRHHYHFVLEDHRGFRFEVHWDLTRPRDPFRPAIEWWWEGIREVSCLGSPVRTLAPERNVFHFSLQNAQEGFTRLSRLYDLVRVLEKERDSIVQRMARDLLLEHQPVAYLSLRLARELLGAKVEERELERLHVGWPTRLAFGALRFQDAMVEQTALLDPDIRFLFTFWLSCGARAKLRRLRELLLPDDSLLERSLQISAAEIGVGRRIRFRVRRLLTVVKLVAYHVRRPWRSSRRPV